jgi:hypothetical protein
MGRWSQQARRGRSDSPDAPAISPMPWPGYWRLDRFGDQPLVAWIVDVPGPTEWVQAQFSSQEDFSEKVDYSAVFHADSTQGGTPNSESYVSYGVYVRLRYCDSDGINGGPWSDVKNIYIAG